MIKSVKDDRYDVECVCTHGGNVKVKADFVVDKLSDIKDLHTFKRIFVDELHFFVDAVEVIQKLVLTTECHIFTTSLNGTSADENGKRTPFECVTQLLPYTSEMHIIKAVCFTCRADTLLTETTAFGKEQHKLGIYVGGLGMYEAKCIKCINAAKPDFWFG